MCIGTSHQINTGEYLSLSLLGYPKIQDWGTLEYPTVFLYHLFYLSQRQIVFPMEGKRAFLVFYLCLYMYIHIYFLTSKYIKTKHLDTGPANCKQGNCMVQTVWCCWFVICLKFISLLSGKLIFIYFICN